MTDFLKIYVEMQDMEFSVYLAAFMFGAIVLLGLVGKFIKAKPDPKPVVGPAPVESLNESSAPVASVGASPEVDGMMMWEGDDGKKKKSKPTPVAKPPKKVVEKPAPLPPAEPVPPVPAEDKTVVLPPKEIKEGEGASPPSPSDPVPVSPSAETATVPASLPPSAVTDSPVPETPPVPVAPLSTDSPVPPAAETFTGAEPRPPQRVPSVGSPVTEDKSVVDFQMYETLLRRIAGLEADLKREPLFLDPLMKRVGNSEKKLDELAKGTAGASKPIAGAVENGARGSALEAEVKELREKVGKLQKILETLSEGPTVP
jgi:hypothetical protein